MTVGNKAFLYKKDLVMQKEWRFIKMMMGQEHLP